MKSTTILLSQLLILALAIQTIHSFKLVPNPNAGQFLKQPVAGGDDNNLLSKPTNLLFLPDGRIFITEKEGRIRVIDQAGNLKAEPWLDITDRVHAKGDKGLLSVAVHPEFSKNGLVYLSYPETRAIGANNENQDNITQGVLVEYKEVGGRADPASARIIIGKTMGTGFPSCHNSHMTGTVMFGLDGTLFASSGDGSHWDFVDDGTDKTRFDYECAAIFGTAVDIGALRAQNLNNLAGKIIRIDVASGNGIGNTNFPNLQPNPFFEAANPASPKSMIWDFGFRNPWRMKIRADTTIPGPGTILLGEPGMKCWEEFNAIRFGGDSYGWPCVSGPQEPQPMYGNATLSQITHDTCQGIYPKPNRAPLAYWTREPISLGHDVGFTGNCAGDIAVYMGDSYPIQYRGDSSNRAIFFSDYGGQWIKVLWINENDEMIEAKGIQEFDPEAGAIVGLRTHPTTGELYTVDFKGYVYKYVYAQNSNSPPIVIADATPRHGNVAKGPVEIQFSSDGTFDAENEELLFEWDFGDGAKSNDPNPKHTYTTGGAYKVQLKVTDSSFLSSNTTVDVVTNNAAPSVKITSPVSNMQFSETDTVTLSAQVSDDNTAAGQLKYRWEIRLIHNNHYHPDSFVAFTASVDNVVLNNYVSSLERNSLEIYCAVTDSNGLTTTDMVKVRPDYLTNEKPVANMVLTPATGPSKLTIEASALATADADEDLLYFQWNWGDGVTGSGMTTRHTYGKEGTYTVTLTVTDVFNTVESTTRQIIVTKERTVLPSITPRAGEMTGDQTVTIRTLSPNSVIYYTTDGSTPTTSSTKYTAPFVVKDDGVSVTIKALAVNPNLVDSAVASVEYLFGGIPTDGIVGYWSFDDISATSRSVTDCSRYGQDGAVTNLSSVPGKKGNAASFSGNSLVTVESTSSIEIVSQMTISLFVKVVENSNDVFSTILSKRSSDTSADGYELQYNSLSNIIKFSTGSDADTCQATFNFDNANWHHLAVTVQDNDCHIYVDNKEVTTRGFVPSMIASNQDLLIGNDVTGKSGFSGSLDELFIYNVVLDENSITTLSVGTGQRKNRAPLVILPSSASASVNVPFKFEGSAYDDCLPEKATITYSWSQKSGPSQVKLVTDYVKQGVAYAVFPQSGTYEFQLSASDGSSVPAGTDTISVVVSPAQSAVPAIEPAGGFFPTGSSVTVTLSSPYVAKIYYTTDGTDPTTSSSLYISPITISKKTTLKAKAFEDSLPASVVVSQTYSFGDVQDGLVLHYRFDGETAQGSGKVEDFSATKAVGTLVGGTKPTFAQGTFGNALVINSLDQFVDAGNVLTNTGEQLTVTAWIQVSNPTISSNMRIVGKKGSFEEAFGWAFDYNPALQQLSFVGSDRDTGYAQNVNLGTGWHHVAAIINGGDVLLVVDGKDVTTDSQVSPITETATRPLRVGSDGGSGSTFIGKIDDLRIYNKAITVEQVRLLMRGYCGDTYCTVSESMFGLDSYSPENCVVCSADCGAAPCGICGDGVCSDNENCTSCSDDCSCSGDSWSFESGNLKSFKYQDAIIPFYPLSVVKKGVQPYSPFFSSDPTSGSYALLTGWDGCGPDKIIVQRNRSVSADTCHMTFDYRAQYDLATFNRAKIGRTFEVIVEVNNGPCKGSVFRHPLYVAQPGKKEDSGKITASIDMSYISAASDVNIIFSWSIPECYSGPALFQMDNIQFAKCTPETTNVCASSTTEVVITGGVSTIGGVTTGGRTTTTAAGTDEHFESGAVNVNVSMVMTLVSLIVVALLRL